jgi:hypothetical protein
MLNICGDFRDSRPYNGVVNIERRVALSGPGGTRSSRSPQLEKDENKAAKSLD